MWGMAGREQRQGRPRTSTTPHPDDALLLFDMIIAPLNQGQSD